MKRAQAIIPQLRRLAELEKTRRQLAKAKAATRPIDAEIESVRAVLPTSILSHHDSRTARGKLSIAPVVRGICRACFIALPRSRVSELRSVDEVNVCDYCGAFIYLEEETPAPVEAPAKAARRTTTTKQTKKKGRTASAEAVAH